MVVRSFMVASVLSIVGLSACGDGTDISTSAASSSSATGGGTAATGGAGGEGVGGAGGGEPIVVETGLAGFGGAPPAVGTSDVFFSGDYVTNNVYAVARYDGAAGQLNTLSLAGLDGTRAGAVALSPNGAELLVAGRDAMSTSDFLCSYDATTFAPLTTLLDTNGLATHEVRIFRMTYSPDQSQIAFVAAIDSNKSFALYVIPSQGGAAPKRVSQIPPTNGLVEAYAWVDDATLAYVGDVIEDNVATVWSVDVTAQAPTPIPLLPLAGLAPLRDVSRTHLDVDAQGRIYFSSSHEMEGRLRLYRANAGGSNLEQVPGTAIQIGGAEAAIGTWGLSPDGTAVAFGTEPLITGAVGQVYVLPLSGSEAQVVTNFASNAADDATHHIYEWPIAWDPLGNTLAFGGDWPSTSEDIDNQDALFVCPIGDTSVVRVVRPAGTGTSMGALEVLFSTDGSRLYVRGDFLTAGSEDLLVTDDFTTADQPPSSLQVTAAPPVGDVRSVARVPAL